MLTNLVLILITSKNQSERNRAVCVWGGDRFSSKEPRRNYLLSLPHRSLSQCYLSDGRPPVLDQSIPYSVGLQTKLIHDLVVGV